MRGKKKERNADIDIDKYIIKGTENKVSYIHLK